MSYLKFLHLFVLNVSMIILKLKKVNKVIHLNGLISTILLLLSVTVASTETRSDEFKKSLEAMGYTEIAVKSCSVSFARSVVPTFENNEFSKYERAVDLSSLDLREGITVEEIQYSKGQFYAVAIPYSETYLNGDHFKTIMFDAFLRRRFPNESWPYENPEYQTTLTPVLESMLKSHISNYRELNFWTDYSKFGPSTRFPTAFEITSLEKAPLEIFSRDLSEYFDEQKCGSVD